MHSRETVTAALQFKAQGLSDPEIGRLLGVPRATVRNWCTKDSIPHSHTAKARKGLAAAESCQACGHRFHDFESLPPAYAHLLGLYLGDGCISWGRRDVWKLRIALDKKYPAIIEECVASMQEVMPANRVNPARTTDWQRECVESHPRLLLRGLIQSDGCRFINTGHGGWRCPRYSFTNISEDIKGIFSDACDLLGVHTTHAPHTVYVSRKADVAFLDTFIGPKA